MRFDPNQYVSVAERIEKFYDRFPEGRILTKVVENDFESGQVLVRAEVYRDPADTFAAASGHAYEVKGGAGANQTSHVENAETSAVGRALAMLGFEVKRGVASREEVQRAERQPSRPAPVKAEPETEEAHAAVDEQIMALLQVLGRNDKDLNEYAAKKYNGGQVVPWEDYALTHKRAMLAFLQEKAPKAVA